jgi:hypothetical protein
VIPQVQWEQHHPVKSSPSTQIKCLFIHLPFCACVWDSSLGAAGGIHFCIEGRRVDFSPPHSIFHLFAVHEST